MKTFCSKMMGLLTIASLLLISLAPGESFENFADEDEMIVCFLRLSCKHDKYREFVNLAEEAGPEIYQMVVDAIRKLIETYNVHIPGNDSQFWTQVIEKGCALSEEQQKALFREVCATNGENLMEICTNPALEACVKGEVALDQFAVLLAKYKAMGLCPVSEIPDIMESPMKSPMKSPFGF